MTNTVLGFRLSSDFNDSTMCCSTDAVKSTGVEVCDRCGFRRDFQFVDPGFLLVKQDLDVSLTVDGYRIVSERFRVHLSKWANDDDFQQLPNSPGHWLFSPLRVIEIDRALLRFENLCSLCNNYESVVGTVALPESCSEPIPPGVYRSDVRLGNRNAKSFATIVSIDVARAIEDGAFSGVALHEIRVMTASERTSLHERIQHSDLEAMLEKARKPWWKVW